MDNQYCAGGCGFFGTAATDGLCSKCYKYYVKEKMDEITRFDEEQSATLVKLKKLYVTDPVVVKNRCGCCNKKIGVLGFQRRCGGTFCSMHRLPEAHPCSFDLKKAGKITIQKENPICKADKMVNRI